MKKILVLTFLSALFAFNACGNNSELSRDSEVNSEVDPIKIVTTIPPLYSFTASLIEGTDIELVNILPPNASAHSFQLTPALVKEISEADLIVMNGLELELFLEDVLTDFDGEVVVASENVEAIKYGDEHDHEEEDHEEDEDHDDEDHDEEDHDEEDHEDDEHKHHHGEFDPHVWLSPKNAKLQSESIMNALISLDSKNEKIYRDNFRDLEGKIDDLDVEIIQALQNLDVKPYIVFHDAYRYFENYYGLEAVAYLEEFPGIEPSVEYLSEVIEIIESENIEVIFSEPQFSPKLVQTLSTDYDLKVGELDPLGTTVTKDSYFEMMRKNYQEFERVFNE